MFSLTRPLFLTLVLGGAACGFAGCTSKSSSSKSTAAPALAGTQLGLSAGLMPLDPAPAAAVGSVDLGRLGVTGVTSVYELTTPPGETFAFNVFARGAGNTGAVRVSVAHGADGGAVPTGGTSSIAESGVIPSGSGLADRDPWIDAQGDGFARLALRGSITRDQAYAFEAQTPTGTERVLVHVRLGARSAINTETLPPPDAPFILEERTLYSSDSWAFGLPTCATTGDRTTVVVYEGDEGQFNQNRYEMRLQADRAGNVTGGASTETSVDSGSWRDHEVSALFNVLAVAHVGDQDVNVRLSFDRGATFAQSETLSTGSPHSRQRLVQTAMAADYTLAVLYWGAGVDGLSELVLSEGTPSAFDTAGSPTRYAFSAPTVVRRVGADVTPIIMGVAYSTGGDLVLGYGYSEFINNPNQPGMTRRSEFRCATRLHGQPTFDDTFVDSDISISFDPSVALDGQGATMSIFYAYETQEGVKLRRSADAGKTFSAATLLGDRTAHLPSVFANTTAAGTRVTVLYLEQRDFGTELHAARWDVFSPAAPTVHRLTTSTSSTNANGIPTGKCVAWLGYDACADGDDVVVIYHETEQTWGPVPMVGPAIGAPMALASAAAGSFTPAVPPPLAAGLTTPLPAADPADAHQLKLIRID